MAVHDIAIIGGGPAGLYLAGLLEDSFDVIVIEKQHSVGHKVCSGLISKNLDRFIDPEDTVDHVVTGAMVHAPGGAAAPLKKTQGVYVINRNAFDRMLAERLSIAPSLGSQAERIDVSSDCASVKTACGFIKAAAVIGCDGAASITGRAMGQRPKDIVTGLKITTLKKDGTDSVDIFFDKNVADGFLWKIPRGSSTEYGAIGHGVKFDAVERFFKVSGIRSAAPIPMGPCRTFSDRMMLIGDAAGQTKPWSGGGVIFGFTAADAAAAALKACFDAEDFSARATSVYEKEWKKAIGKQIDMGLLARAMLMDMDNNGLDSLVSKLAGEDMTGVDMDFPFSLG